MAKADYRLFEHIAARCKELGITPGYVCNELGIRRAFMTEVKSGRTKYLSASTIADIADFLRVSTDYLITGEYFQDNLTETEHLLLAAWRQATDDERENVAFLLRKYGLELPRMVKEEENAG